MWQIFTNFVYFRPKGVKSDNGYPHDGRADKDPYPHDRRAEVLINPGSNRHKLKEKKCIRQFRSFESDCVHVD